MSRRDVPSMRVIDESPRRLARATAMSRPPRITNRERVLLALEDAAEHENRFEMPRRFGQRGLAARLEMAQSHVSRAMNELIDSGAVVARRRRVAGEKRRVNAYFLTDRGRDRLVDLVEGLESAEVLTRGADGALEQHRLGALAESWSKDGSRIDPLALAEMLRAAEAVDGMQVVERPDHVAVDSEDLSSEAIGLHLELAEMHAAQGRKEAAIEHLRRAGDLHRRRGSIEGEARCLIAAAGLGAEVEEPARLRAGVEAIGDPIAAVSIALDLHDAWCAAGESAAADAWLLPRLESVWGDGANGLAMPLAGHVGFRLAALVDREREREVLTALRDRFAASDEEALAIVDERLSAW